MPPIRGAAQNSDGITIQAEWGDIQLTFAPVSSNTVVTVLLGGVQKSQATIATANLAAIETAAAAAIQAQCVGRMDTYIHIISLSPARVAIACANSGQSALAGNWWTKA